MTAVLILMVIFGGVALIKYMDNLGQAQRRTWKLEEEAARAGAALPSSPQSSVKGALPAAGAGPSPAAPASETLLRLPEPARSRAWALLCLMADAQADAGSAAPDARTTYLLRQTRESYLPDTLRAYLGLTDGARRTLQAQGQSPETLLNEQLALMEDGVREALRHDHAAADRLLTQGRFLRERFGVGEGELNLS